jgi:hypothetical protein
MTLAMIYLASISSGQGNVVLADMTQVEYTGGSSVRLPYHVSYAGISVILLCHILFIQSSNNPLYSWTRVS